MREIFLTVHYSGHEGMNSLNSIRFEGMRDEIGLFWIMIKVE